MSMRHRNGIRLVRTAAIPCQFPAEGPPEVAFVGRSNVGKSSLINTLVGRKSLARTSQTPGKTRMIHFYSVEDSFLLVDLPGYGYAKVPKEIKRNWMHLAERYLGSRKSLRLVVFIMDIRRVPDDDDLHLAEWLREAGKHLSFVITKVDKVSKGKRRAHMDRIARRLGVPAEEMIPFSSRTGEGRRRLWGEIVKYTG